MAITRASLADRAALAAWLQENAVPEYFASVTYTDSKIQGFDEDGNKLLEITSTGGIYAYSSANSYLSWTSDYTLIGLSKISLIACDNGILFENMYNGSNGKIMVCITKTNNDKTAIVFSANSTSKVSGYYTDIRHVAWGDNETVTSTTTFTPENGMQTVLVPFVTNADIESVSYTPDAFWISMNFNYNMGIGKFRMGGDMFISNGYWAVRDGQSD